MGDGMVLIELPGYGHRKCSACGGSGVVEATTTYGLEPLGWDRVAQRWITAEGETVYRLRPVALPEETPHA